MTMFEMHVARRRFVAGALCTPVAGMARWSGAAGRGGTLDPQQRLRTYMLLRGALDEQLVISCITCEYFGVVDGAMTPFYDLVAATFARFRASPNGGYDAVTFEIEYFIDRATGGVLDQWRNPYSGEVVKAKHNDSVPMKFRIGADASVALAPTVLIPGTRIDREPPQFDVLGDEAWVRERTIMSIPVAGGKPLQFNEFVTYHAESEQLTRAGVTRLKSDTTYLGISSFRPWQAMHDRPGHMIGYGIGGNGVAMSDLPPRWLAATKQRHPEALSAPGAYLDPLWRTL